jgi:hypothetical protein
VPRIRVDLKISYNNILLMLEKDIRQGMKEVGFAIVEDWNSRAKLNLGRQEGNGDTNNMLRSVFAGMWDFSLKFRKSKRQVVPRMYPSQHGGKSNSYAHNLWGKWTTDNFSDLVGVQSPAKSHKQDWIISIAIDKLFANLPFATGVTTKSGGNFSYSNTSLNKHRTARLKRSFNGAYRHVADKFCKLIFGG